MGIFEVVRAELPEKCLISWRYFILLNSNYSQPVCMMASELLLVILTVSVPATSAALPTQDGICILVCLHPHPKLELT